MAARCQLMLEIDIIYTYTVSNKAVGKTGKRNSI